MDKVGSIAIVGGGLAGLATAQALAQFGIEADVFERASTLAEIGSGTDMSPQAVKALKAIGLSEKLNVANVHPDTYTYNMHTGELVTRQDAQMTVARYGEPWLTFHRADLLTCPRKQRRSSARPSQPSPRRG